MFINDLCDLSICVLVVIVRSRKVVLLGEVNDSRYRCCSARV